MKVKYYFFDYIKCGARCYTNPGPAVLQGLKARGHVFPHGQVGHLLTHPPEYWRVNNAGKPTLADPSMWSGQVERKNAQHMEKVRRKVIHTHPHIKRLRLFFYLQTAAISAYILYNERESLIRLVEYLRGLYVTF